MKPKIIITSTPMGQNWLMNVFCSDEDRKMTVEIEYYDE